MVLRTAEGHGPGRAAASDQGAGQEREAEVGTEVEVEPGRQEQAYKEAAVFDEWCSASRLAYLLSVYAMVQRIWVCLEVRKELLT